MKVLVSYVRVIVAVGGRDGLAELLFRRDLLAVKYVHMLLRLTTLVP